MRDAAGLLLWPVLVATLLVVAASGARDRFRLQFKAADRSEQGANSKAQGHTLSTERASPV
ncbi:hypothetical protein [Bosea sp. BH3]|uniref:hypothetical protein n=1 Tax=Bosea sp. BH3 TaxID=2871701 RepID=UPI0021CB67FF|nr:hypothetical protein [Bosea sp. BH3]MCU4181158.1 hypothetical protein [Bosea sp. BH3]